MGSSSAGRPTASRPKDARSCARRGFAPTSPRPTQPLQLVELQRGFRCPYCGSTDTKLDNLFGPTPCRSVRYCHACRQPSEQFKTI
jgi:ring-1,2-phenylacetyl-CoA epoxidase subunit PaaD